MRISRPGGGLFAGTGVGQRHSNATDGDGDRIVRRIRLGVDVARIDLRLRPDGVLASVTIASETTQPLSAMTIERIVGDHARLGALVFRTPAVTPEEAVGYRRSGFVVVSELRLLTRDLDPTNGPDRAARRLHRARASDLAGCAAVDRRAFGPDHCFDRHDLAAALDATDRARLRLVSDLAHADRDFRPVAAFAITGRAGRRGYLQRLAVDPSLQGQGVGTALVLDALRWCHRRGARRVVVNTSTENARALSLYRGLGFVDAPLELLLMERRV
jgi:ribosomal protein S18 acetylase RimI-like enzyme